MDLSVLKTADAVGAQIGNPVQYTEGKKHSADGGFTTCPSDLTAMLALR